MRRRVFLGTIGSSVAIGIGAGNVTAEGDADPRPNTGGELPNKNVPYTETGALGRPPFNETSEIPAGNWILHDNGWLNFESKQQAVEFANSSHQRYIIDGEVFILDEFEDWQYNPPANSEDDLALYFDYFTPPKPKGKTYEIRWEFDSGGKYERIERIFPYSNEVEIVGGQ